jgi:voltage-gated potassium channel
LGHLQSELAVSGGMVAAAVLIHLVGLSSLLQWVRWHINHLKTPWIAVDRLAVPLGMVTGLFLIHSAEVWSYAPLYRRLAFPGFEQALYATGAYSTASLTLFDHAPRWRLVAAHESVVGMLLLGWSTAFLFATLHRILTTEETHPLPEGAIAAED